MKKILLLGGSAQQVIAIDTAKRLGYSAVLCDFLLNNPFMEGRKVPRKAGYVQKHQKRKKFFVSTEESRRTPEKSGETPEN